MNYDMEKFFSVRHRLDNATATLTQKIIEFEEEMKKLSMGIPVMLKLPSSDIAIGYGKWDSSWHLLIIYKAADGHEITNRLLDAPRNLRLFGYKHRMEILPALEKSAESLAERMEKAITGEEE